MIKMMAYIYETAGKEKLGLGPASLCEAPSPSRIESILISEERIVLHRSIDLLANAGDDLLVLGISQYLVD